MKLLPSSFQNLEVSISIQHHVSSSFLLELHFHDIGHQPETVKTKDSDKKSSRLSSLPCLQVGQLLHPSGHPWRRQQRLWGGVTCRGPQPGSGRAGPPPRSVCLPYLCAHRGLEKAGSDGSLGHRPEGRCCQTTTLLLQLGHMAATQRIHLLPTQASLAYGPQANGTTLSTITAAFLVK